MRFVKVYCLICGDQSDSDISMDDAYDWSRDHDDSHPELEWAKIQYDTVPDGYEHQLGMTTVAGFKVGDLVYPIDVLDAYDGSWPRAITGFAIYGYQGIVANVEGTAIYLDHAAVQPQ